MNITFLSPVPNLSGGIRVIAIHAQKLQDRGHTVIIVAVNTAKPSFTSQVRSLIKHHHTLKHVQQHTSHYDGISVPVTLLPHAGPITNDDLPDADVVIATWWETAEWIQSLAPSKGVKVHFMQDYEIWTGQKERVDATCRAKTPKIVIAKWVTRMLEEQFGQSPLAYVPDSVDTDLFFAPPRSKNPVPTVGLTYATMLNKGTDLSLKAVEIARREIPNLRLLVFGNCAIQPELPLPGHATYFKCLPSEKLRDIYAQCDAWLFGTRIEGFGLPILEAMACRTPVIGAAAGAAPELLAGGGGILCPLENANALADGIKQIHQMSNPQWRTMSDAAYLTATSFTWDDAATLFEDALTSAVSSRGPARESSTRTAVPQTAGLQ